MMAEQVQAVSIGDISELKGKAELVRAAEDLNIEAIQGGSIRQNDEAITYNGRMALKFLDDSTVKLTEYSQLLIDEYIYDPDPSKSKMALTFAMGTTRFLTGSLKKIDKQNITLKTPTANIAIRGTELAVTVNELGESLIINLPYGEFGTEIGEIEVITGAGSVILNKPFEATTVSVYENSPSKPVIIDLTLDQLDNMLIISPPKEKISMADEQIASTKNILDYNDLDIDYLDEDLLAEEETFDELSINYLDVNFLEDLLDVLDALEVAEEDELAQDGSSLSIVGTEFGQDTTTQVTTFITGQVLTLQRNVSAQARLDLDVGGSYTVIFIQDGVSRVITINGGSSNYIKITQSQ